MELQLGDTFLISLLLKFATYKDTASTLKQHIAHSAYGNLSWSLEEGSS